MVITPMILMFSMTPQPLFVGSDDDNPAVPVYRLGRDGTN